MPVQFQLQERPAGFAVAPAEEGQRVAVIVRELVSPNDATHLFDRLQRMQSVLFSKIPGAPKPSQIDHLLVVISADLTATAYTNELTNITAQVEINRGVNAGDPIYVSDIENITSVDLGVEIPDDCAVVFVRSQDWRRSLFFDFGPLHDGQVRDFSLEEVLAQQAMLLIGLLPGGAGVDDLDEMDEGIVRLRALLNERCTDEAMYQELLEDHPWMLGGQYSAVRRHARLDDRAIPDFTATRCYDDCDDIIELKQPFLELFRQDGTLANNFNDAWNQTERYLAFAERQRIYVQEERGIVIENPRGLLIAGHDLPEDRRRLIRQKVARSTSVTVVTYDELLRVAENIMDLVRSAGNRAYP